MSFFRTICVNWLCCVFTVCCSVLLFAAQGQQAKQVRLYTPDLVISVQDRKNDPETFLALQALLRVDSVAQAGGTGSHFAKIYTKVMANIELQLQGVDNGTAAFIRKFENRFAEYFFIACQQHENGNLPTSSPWHNLFSNPSVHPVRSTVMGINAHTNADIWQALVNNFTGEEIRTYRKRFLSFQASIAKVYFPFYDSVALDSWYMRFMRSMTKGLVKNLGERIIYKWRVRAINLAITYFEDPEKFQRKLRLANRKKEKIDRKLISRLQMILGR